MTTNFVDGFLVLDNGGCDTCGGSKNTEIVPETSRYIYDLCRTTLTFSRGFKYNAIRIDMS